MKKTILIILVAFFAGLGGAFTYYKIQSEFMTTELSENNIGSPGNELPELPTIDPDNIITVNESNNNSVRPEINFNEDFVDASEKSTNSVVYIKTVSNTLKSYSWYELFFNDRTDRRKVSTGSGVIFTSDGYIVTNNHVIENADFIEVIYQKRSYEAQLIGADPSTDLAVLKIDASSLPKIKFGNSRELKVGEWVLAIGNPFNLTSTVTAGIVSAKGRNIPLISSNFPIESFIQTDAAINPGNSGGALVNSKGELVGINIAIVSNTGSYAGYGFAVPVDIVAKVVEDIIEYGEVQKAFFGAEVLNVTQEIASELELESLSGVIITNLQDDLAADNAGLNKGDIVQRINNQEIDSKSEFDEMISYFSPGDKINVEYTRNKQERMSELVLTNREGTTSILKREIYTSRQLGADFEVVSKVERDLLKISHGIRITEIRSGFIRQLDIDEGFIVTYINKYPIKDPEELAEILIKIRGRVTIEGINKNGVRGYYRYFF
ncbi:S1C family serine protease [Bacteroidota bacterium]